MYFTLDVLISKSDINKISLSEILFGWGGELLSQDPPKYTNNSKLIFEQYMDMKYYESFIGSNLNINNYIALSLEGEHILDLELLINNQSQELSSNEVMLFFLELFKLDTFAILLIRDEECIDKKYKINKKEELIDIICNSLNWSSPQGVLITKI